MDWRVGFNMKVLICGSRSITDYEDVVEAIENSGFVATSIIHGGARGVDRLAGKYAKEIKVACVVVPAQWDLYGKSAGYRRNIEMCNYCDVVVACWNGVSSGTAHSIDYAKKLGKPVYVYNPRTGIDFAKRYN